MNKKCIYLFAFRCDLISLWSDCLFSSHPPPPTQFHSEFCSLSDCMCVGACCHLGTELFVFLFLRFNRVCFAEQQCNQFKLCLFASEASHVCSSFYSPMFSQLIPPPPLTYPSGLI